MAGAQIAGRLYLPGAKLGGAPASRALDADGSVIGTDLVLSRVHACGEIRVRTSRIGGRVQLGHAMIESTSS